MKKNIRSSSVFQKFVMGVTGLLLVGFVITHLLGNLTLYSTQSTLFNAYAEKLHSLGPLLIVAELALVVFFGIHIVTGLRLALQARAAKPTRYASTQTKGKDLESNPNTRSSRNMAITGTVLLVFLVAHIIHFKYGAGIAEGYTTLIDGKEVRDLHRLVVEQFKNPIVSILYVVVMFFLGMHLKHGFWSAFQSLGLTREDTRKKLIAIAFALAVLLSVGFLFIPIVIYFR